MGYWYLALFISFLVILIGLSLHWSVVLAGALLPFVPLVSLVLRRRRRDAASRREVDPGN
jgi:uncharacterized membrane protein YjjP (DUF1212 family)